MFRGMVWPSLAVLGKGAGDGGFFDMARGRRPVIMRRSPKRVVLSGLPSDKELWRFSMRSEDGSCSLGRPQAKPRRKRRPVKCLSDFLDKCLRADSGCLEWDGFRNPLGYGRQRFYGRNILAHRLAWILTVGEIPSGLLVCHRCDNPSCVEVSHLFLGTNADNIRDRDRKGRGRQPRGEGSGMSKLTEAQAVEIYHRSAVVGETCARIAEEFGVSASLVSEIKRRNIWRHIHRD